MSPQIVNQQDWIEASKVLLEKEKKLMRAADDLSAARRELPMVRIDKPYSFLPATTSSAAAVAPLSLSDLFDGMDQLIVYHFMFAPGDDDEGRDVCRGCTHVAESLPDARHLRSRRTQLACVSRAPPARLAAYQERCGWTDTFPWYSTAADPDNAFNRDFHVSVDQGSAGAYAGTPGSLLNFRSRAEVAALGRRPYTGEYFGFSVFWKDEEGRVFHTYSTYGRGVERVSATFALLDITPLGRQDMPEGPAAFKVRHEYEKEA
ncbi:hypothetical protein ISF_05412 [Cordyceps fumosorosea ARSEF 2679]|uniref:DUF899 domain-containing protein n=1 Tax=Cordyceps fumosorosea (strain ARSEF 2679) TaxID=1081104 RepID=A0A167U8F8_CORFA|nr:hypothetical protein ISF_05412 [Cordyceps fumosorosea ARSEF 2679]OAA61333.1 hypothetical protein ISF_05412 [Cordyceps fumosorosea ARSEF 2679]